MALSPAYKTITRNRCVGEGLCPSRCHSEPVLTGHWCGNPQPLPLPSGEVAERSEDGEGRHVKKICQWHIFSVDLSGYAAVASILVCTASSFSVDLGSYAAVASIRTYTALSWIPSQSPSVTALPKGEPRAGHLGPALRSSIGSRCVGAGLCPSRCHWLAMTKTGRCTPRVLVPLRSTAWASPPTECRASCKHEVDFFCFLW